MSPTLSFICSTVEADSKRLYFPRSAHHRPPRRGIHAGRPASPTRAAGGPEFEFYVFDKVSSRTASTSPATAWIRREADWHSARGRPRPLRPAPRRLPRHPAQGSAPQRAHPDRDDAGGDGRAGEVPPPRGGRPGQCEIETPLLGLLQAADASQTIKYVAKMVARQTGQTVTFMPKPLYGEAGNGMHFHQHLFKGGRQPIL